MITPAANYKLMHDKIQDAMFKLDEAMLESGFDYAEVDVRESIYKAYIQLSHARAYIAPWMDKED